MTGCWTGAAGLIDQVDDEYPWGNACRRTHNYIDVQRATAYVRLGAWREAADLWERILGAMPESARRDNGVFWARQASAFWARQASALAVLPEPDRVVEIASATVTVIGDTGSARLRRELKAIGDRAAKWRRTRQGQELTEIISNVA